MCVCVCLCMCRVGEQVTGRTRPEKQKTNEEMAFLFPPPPKSRMEKEQQSAPPPPPEAAQQQVRGRQPESDTAAEPIYSQPLEKRHVHSPTSSPPPPPGGWGGGSRGCVRVVRAPPPLPSTRRPARWVVTPPASATAKLQTTKAGTTGR